MRRPPGGGALERQGGRLVVGHSISGLLASMFAARFSVQAVVNVGQSLDVREPAAAAEHAPAAAARGTTT